MTTKLKQILIGGTIVIGLAIGTILYKLDDIKKDIYYRNFWKNNY